VNLLTVRTHCRHCFPLSKICLQIVEPPRFSGRCYSHLGRWCSSRSLAARRLGHRPVPQYDRRETAVTFSGRYKQQALPAGQLVLRRTVACFDERAIERRLSQPLNEVVAASRPNSPGELRIIEIRRLSEQCHKPMFLLACAQRFPSGVHDPIYDWHQGEECRADGAKRRAIRKKSSEGGGACRKLDDVYRRRYPFEQARLQTVINPTVLLLQRHLIPRLRGVRRSHRAVKFRAAVAQSGLVHWGISQGERSPSSDSRPNRSLHLPACNGFVLARGFYDASGGKAQPIKTRTRQCGDSRAKESVTLITAPKDESA